MRVLVTRPEADAAALVAELEARGHRALTQPLLMIEPVAVAEPLDLDSVQAVLFTSANGVRAFADRCAERRLPVFAVGDASGAEARAAGFERVESAGGDVEDLARLVIARLDPAAGCLFHGAGASLAGDLGGALEAAGFAVRRAVLYNAQPAEALSEDVRTALTEGCLDAIVLFSPRTASTFIRLMGKHRLAAACAGCWAICLSAAVATPLTPLDWAGIAVAEQPSTAALLDKLDDVAHGRATGTQPS